MSDMTIRDVLNGLKGIDPEAAEAKALELARKPVEIESPWFVRLFVGASAWFAAGLLVAFLGVFEIFFQSEIDLLWGLMFCTAAIALNMFFKKNLFLSQLALGLSFTGQILFVTGFASLFTGLREEVIAILIALIVLEVILLIVYNDRFHRFVSTLVIGGSIVILLMFELEAWWSIHGIVALFTAGFVALKQLDHTFIVNRLERLTRPIGYGLVILVLGLLQLPLINDEFLFDGVQIRWWISAMLLFGVFLYAIYMILTDLDYAPTEQLPIVLFAGSLVLLIPGWTVPGVIGAMTIMMVGFWRNNWLLIGLAAIGFAYYLIAYYYLLDITLLIKSLILLATGGTLFGLRYGFLRITAGGEA